MVSILGRGRVETGGRDKEKKGKGGERKEKETI